MKITQDEVRSPDYGLCNLVYICTPIIRIAGHTIVYVIHGPVELIDGVSL